MQTRASALERWRFSATVLVPAMLVLLLTGAAVCGFMLWSTASTDERAYQIQSQTVAQVLENRRLGMLHEQESVAISDDTLRNAKLAYDSTWVRSRLGNWMHRFFEHNRVAVLDQANQPVFVAEHGWETTRSAYTNIMAPVAAPFVERLRLAIAGGALEAFLAGRRASPPAVSEFALVGGRPAIVAATPIFSDTGQLHQIRGSEFMLVSVLELDERLAQSIGREYLIKDPEFVLSPSAKPDRAARPIINAQGRIIGFFEWTREYPSRRLMAQNSPALLAGFTIAAFLVLLLMTQLRRSSIAAEASRRNAEHQAAHDRLTGLPNRSSFDSYLVDMLAQKAGSGTRIDLLLLDLDRFKQVNDTLGHQTGDELICRVSDRIRDVVGKAVFVARIGGDEFALVSTDEEGTDPVELSTRLIEAISRPFTLSQFQAFVGASIGIVSASATEAEPRELVRKADIALYDAKAAGRNRSVVYEEHMNELIQLQHTIEAELREALDDQTSLSVAFQPLVDQRSRRVTGAEALARWQHPKFGHISPARFIPVAENTGLIERLGALVLRRACELGAMAPGRTVAVNISPTQLRNPQFSAQVFDILNATGMRATDLELEITESILLDDEYISAQNVLTFRAAGIHIALDDFGTGYSSLSYLKRYPVDRIKIDRSFVSQLAAGHVSVDITRALVTLAHAMDIEVTAEGVETEEQARILGELGCNTLQGFLFSPAVGPERILDIFNAPQNLPERRRAVANLG